MFVTSIGLAQPSLQYIGTLNALTIPAGIHSSNTLFGGTAIPSGGGIWTENWVKFTTAARRNTAFGQRALRYNIDGFDNTAMGVSALDNSTNDTSPIGTTGGNGNSAFGRSALIGCNSSYNTAVGANSGCNTFPSSWNGSNPLLTGNANTFLGANIFLGLNNLTLSNTVIIGDGGNNNNATGTAVPSNQRIYIHSNGNTGIGLGNFIIPKNRLDVKGGVAIGEIFGAGTTGVVLTEGTVVPTSGLIVEGNTGIGTNSPNNRLEVKSAVPYVVGTVGSSGLRFTNLKSGNIVDPLAAKNGKVLTVDVNGDVVLTSDNVGVQSACATANFVPVNSTTAGQLNCSQIFDNSTTTMGTSVGIGYATATLANAAFPYTINYGISNSIFGVVSSTGSGIARLRVNGVTWSDGFYSPSDKKFKKNIKSIENALTTIEKLNGKTYLWDTEKFKDKNFDGGGHSGLIAQELEEVLPHLVITGQNGEKAVNYMELMPYLVEAIKEQQTQINELKAQVNDNFKSQNGDLLTLKNTKIISVSPNPSNDVILVSMNIEKVVQNAKLLVHDINGLVLSTLNINERDTNITKTLQKDNFGKGIYIVSLVINGKSIDTKKILFN